MSTRIEIIDQIQSSTTSDILLQSKVKFKNAYILADFVSDDEIPNIRAVKQLVVSAVAGPVTIATNQTGYTPVQIATFMATYGADYGPVPTLIVQEVVGTVKTWRNDVRPAYDSSTDTLTLDFFNTATGFLTIKV